MQSAGFKPSSVHAGMAELLRARVGHEDGGHQKVSAPPTACERTLGGCSRGYAYPCLHMEPVWRVWVAATSSPARGAQSPCHPASQPRATSLSPRQTMLE